MLARMKKHLTEHQSTRQIHDVITVHHAGVMYKIPQSIIEKYACENDYAVNADDLFADINKKYSKPGALLRGLRARENLSQVEIAERIGVTQSDISQMETGARKIGSKIAQRIEKLFDIDYRSFLE